MQSHRTESSACPHCGRALDGAGNADGKTDPPKPGDLSVCFYCATGLVFTETGLREMRDADLRALTIKERIAFENARLCVLRHLTDQ